MFSVANQFDIYITASGSDEVRQATLRRLLELYPLDATGQVALARGERVLLRGQVSDAEAKRVTSSVRALGLRVDTEEHRGALDVGEIDGFTADAPAQVIAAPENLFFNVSAGLVGLDGEDDEPAARGEPPARTLSPAADTPATMKGLFAAQPHRPSLRHPPPPPPRGGVAPAARPAPTTPATLMPDPVRAPPPIPAPPVSRPAPMPDAQRFGPSGRDSGSMDILVDRPAPDPMLSVPQDHGKETFVVPRCPTHDVPKVGSRCPSCDAEDAAVRGKLFGGALRSRLPLRVGLGLFGGLLVGWIATAPMARRAERQVAYIREEARLEHLRPLEEAQAHAAQLDSQADEESQKAFIRTLGLWTLIAGVLTGVWFRLT